VKLFQKPGDNPEQPVVLLLAFTGKAAALIGKILISL